PDGRLEGIRPGDPPRRRGDPQVHAGAVAARDEARPQARRAYVPVQEADDPRSPAPVPVPVRTREARLTAWTSRSSTTTSAPRTRTWRRAASTTCCRPGPSGARSRSG